MPVPHPGRTARLALLALLLAPALAAAQPAPPARLALVIGNGAYTPESAMAPVPGCPDAARSVAASLRALGFDVTERVNILRGDAYAAWLGFGRRLREAPGAVAVAYVCGRVVPFEGRPFLLPAAVSLNRATDILTQGVLARAALNTLLRGNVRTGLLALDAYAASAAMADLRDLPGLAALADAATAGNLGLLVARTDDPNTPPPLPAALRAGFAGGQVTVAGLIAAVRSRLPPATLQAASAPTAPAFLTGEAAPAPVASASPPAGAVPPTTPPNPAAAAAPPPAVTLPDEDRLEEADRRRVQAALTALGLYSGRADGMFGPGTRVAIRRFQSALRAEPTGILTGPQATRLVAGR